MKRIYPFGSEGPTIRFTETSIPPFLVDIINRSGQAVNKGIQFIEVFHLKVTTFALLRHSLWSKQFPIKVQRVTVEPENCAFEDVSYRIEVLQRFVQRYILSFVIAVMHNIEKSSANRLHGKANFSGSIDLLSAG